MSDLDLSFLNYLLSDRPPVALLKSYRHELPVSDKRVAKVLDFICSTVPDGSQVPSQMTLTGLMSNDIDVLDLLGEASNVDKAAPDIDDFSLLLMQADNKTKQDRIILNLKKSLERNDYSKAAVFADEFALLSKLGETRVAPVDMEDFLDLGRITKAEDFLTTHIPRLNQHLSGEINGIDFEETGGFTFGEVSIIAGSTNKGKSCFATSTWHHFLSKVKEDDKYMSVYFNYENAYDRFLKTIYAHVTGWYPDTPNESATKEYEAFMTSRRGKFLLYAGGQRHLMPTTTDQLEVEIAKLAEKGYRAFFIDTINSLDNRDDSKSHEITERAMRMMERLAQTYNIAIIATAQNKQGLEFEDDKWPGIHWIGESRTIQQKPGTALGIYRADWYSGGTLDYTILALIKARHRAPEPKEGVQVTYDRRRRMYVPYRGSITDVANASEGIKRKQILAALRDDIDVAYAKG